MARRPRRGLREQERRFARLAERYVEALGASDPVFLATRGLYLKNLGRLDAAARCHERGSEFDYRSKNWKNAATGNQNLADVLLLAGRLAAGSEAAGQALRLAERAEDTSARCMSYAYRAHARALRGETSGALADFRDARRWQHEAEWRPDRPFYSLGGLQLTLLLARLGRYEEATRLTEANKQILRELAGPDNFCEPPCNLVLADLARERRDFDAARRLLDSAHEWALARDAKELLCWAALARARLERSRARADAPPKGARRALHDDARRAVEDGLRIARDCGRRDLPRARRPRRRHTHQVPTGRPRLERRGACTTRGWQRSHPGLRCLSQPQQPGQAGRPRAEAASRRLSVELLAG